MFSLSSVPVGEIGQCGHLPMLPVCLPVATRLHVLFRKRLGPSCSVKSIVTSIVGVLITLINFKANRTGATDQSFAVRLTNLWNRLKVSLVLLLIALHKKWNCNGIVLNDPTPQHYAKEIVRRSKTVDVNYSACCCIMWILTVFPNIHPCNIIVIPRAAHNLTGVVYGDLTSLCLYGVALPC